MSEHSRARVKKREKRLQELGASKDLLGLPVEQLERMDKLLLDRWQVGFFETPLSLVEHVVAVASEDAASRYVAANEKAADSLRRGGSEVAVFEAMCDAELLGIVTSSRRGYLLDSVCLALALVRELGLSGPILDAGCHAGIACDMLAEVVKNEVHGVDPVRKAIDFANARVGERARFDVAGIPWATPKRFDLVLAIDSMPNDLADRAKFLHGVSDLLEVGGVAVIVSACWVSADMQTVRRQLSNSHLGFGFADVVGGYSGAPTRFSAEGCMVLIKDGSAQPPRKIQVSMESEWNSFRDYSNAPSTPRSRKTQAFKRSLAITPIFES